MSYFTYYNCNEGLTYTDWKLAGWCQIDKEVTEGNPYVMREHYSPWDWLVAFIEQEPPHLWPSYYTIEPFTECEEGAVFDSWYEDNYTEAFECQNALMRDREKCYTTQLIGTNWLGFRYYKVVPSAEEPPEEHPEESPENDHEPPTYCEFYVLRAKVDKALHSNGQGPRPNRIRSRPR
jgi:hypothetical protein